MIDREITGDVTIGRNILRDHRAHCDPGAIAYPAGASHRGVGPNPNIIANGG